MVPLKINPRSPPGKPQLAEIAAHMHSLRKYHSRPLHHCELAPSRRRIHTHSLRHALPPEACRASFPRCDYFNSTSPPIAFIDPIPSLHPTLTRHLPIIQSSIHRVPMSHVHFLDGIATDNQSQSRPAQERTWRLAMVRGVQSHPAPDTVDRHHKIIHEFQLARNLLQHPLQPSLNRNSYFNFQRSRLFAPSTPGVSDQDNADPASDEISQSRAATTAPVHPSRLVSGNDIPGKSLTSASIFAFGTVGTFELIRFQACNHPICVFIGFNRRHIPFVWTLRSLKASPSDTSLANISLTSTVQYSTFSRRDSDWD
ncbi:hypothetical protein R3P38DRAFT_3188999 [Favolaschia claudopus]|uniref:Uncharacterized protein n=1 Tax=Favolaschia claudopus TaxID=2862362 RepID=A0AAW0BTC6_9AGAR